MKHIRDTLVTLAVVAAVALAIWGSLTIRQLSQEFWGSLD